MDWTMRPSRTGRCDVRHTTAPDGSPLTSRNVELILPRLVLAWRSSLIVIACAAGLVMPAAAAAHVERPAYWPDPAPDCSIKPCTGGKVPAVRSLSSSLVRSRPGSTRVVCQGDSLARLKSSIAAARAHGYDVRPTDHRSLSARQARTLLELNRSL